MSLTCARSKALAVVAAVSLAALGLSAHAQTSSRTPAKGASLEAPVPGAVTVSDSEFNTFVFPEAIKRVFFPAGSPVVGKPIYLADNTQVLLQFSKGHKTPVQMVVELDNGQVVSLRLSIRSVPGVTHAVNGARLRSSPARSTESSAAAATPGSSDIDMLRVLTTTGSPPDGFEPIHLPRPTRFDKFTVIPLAGWSDAVSKRVLVFSLVAVPGQTAVVSPPQFYRPGITAVMLDGDVVDANNSPQLFVVEELRDE